MNAKDIQVGKSYAVVAGNRHQDNWAKCGRIVSTKGNLFRVHIRNRMTRGVYEMWADTSGSYEYDFEADCFLCPWEELKARRDEKKEKQQSLVERREAIQELIPALGAALIARGVAEEHYDCSGTVRQLHERTAACAQLNLTYEALLVILEALEGPQSGRTVADLLVP